MDVISHLAVRERVPAECFELQDSEIRFQQGHPVRAIVYRMRRSGLALVLRDYQQRFAIDDPCERLGLQAMLVRLDRLGGPWNCLSFDEPLRDRLFRLWSNELASFHRYVSGSVESRTDIGTLRCSAPRAWSTSRVELTRQLNARRTPAKSWIITPHMRASLRRGDVLAVIACGTAPTQTQTPLIQRVDDWQNWFGPRFTFVREVESETIACDPPRRGHDLLPWLHPPWAEDDCAGR